MVLKKIGSSVARILVNGTEHHVNEQSDETDYDVQIESSASVDSFTFTESTGLQSDGDSWTTDIGTQNTHTFRSSPINLPSGWSVDVTMEYSTDHSTIFFDGNSIGGYSHSGTYDYIPAFEIENDDIYDDGTYSFVVEYTINPNVDGDITVNGVNQS